MAAIACDRSSNWDEGYLLDNIIDLNGVDYQLIIRKNKTFNLTKDDRSEDIEKLELNRSRVFTAIDKGVAHTLDAEKIHTFVTNLKFNFPLEKDETLEITRYDSSLPRTQAKKIMYQAERMFMTVFGKIKLVMKAPITIPTINVVSLENFLKEKVKVLCKKGIPATDFKKELFALTGLERIEKVCGVELEIYNLPSIEERETKVKREADIQFDNHLNIPSGYPSKPEEIQLAFKDGSKQSFWLSVKGANFKNMRLVLNELKTQLMTVDDETKLLEFIRIVKERNTKVPGCVKFITELPFREKMSFEVKFEDETTRIYQIVVKGRSKEDLISKSRLIDDFLTSRTNSVAFANLKRHLKDYNEVYGAEIFTMKRKK